MQYFSRDLFRALKHKYKKACHYWYVGLYPPLKKGNSFRPFLEILLVPANNVSVAYITISVLKIKSCLFVCWYPAFQFLTRYSPAPFDTSLLPDLILSSYPLPVGKIGTICTKSNRSTFRGHSFIATAEYLASSMLQIPEIGLLHTSSLHLQVTPVPVTESLMYNMFDLWATLRTRRTHVIKEAVHSVARIREVACWCCTCRTIWEL
jgi:hypothetical protein